MPDQRSSATATPPSDPDTALDALTPEQRRFSAVLGEILAEAWLAEESCRRDLSPSEARLPPDAPPDSGLTGIPQGSVASRWGSQRADRQIRKD